MWKNANERHREVGGIKRMYASVGVVSPFQNLIIVLSKSLLQAAMPTIPPTANGQQLQSNGNNQQAVFQRPIRGSPGSFT